MLKLIILFVFVTTTLAHNGFFEWWDLDNNKEYSQGNPKTLPFPQCLLSGSKSNYLRSSNLQRSFDEAIRDEEQSAKYEHYENYKKNNYDVMDYDAREARNNNTKARSAAAAAIKLTNIIMSKLACNLTGTDSTNLNNFLQQFSVPSQFCTFLDQINCTGKLAYHTATGICNNLQNPYEGSSQTAYGRLLPADYQDHISEPRRKSVGGGLLPGCRYISLQLGSKPIFNRNFNNLFVAFGQYIAHDIALALPVTDTYLTPITSCTCGDEYDWNKCTVIPIPPDDPYLRGQKCMAFPATAQAFKDQVCSLGVKEQLNANTHPIDLSGLYGSTLSVSLALRGQNGLLKSQRRAWAKYDLPPGQREGKSCVDSKENQKCFAGGDSRLMIHLLFTGVQTIFLRAHNKLAKAIFELNPTWFDDLIYEETRRTIIAYFQNIVYSYWLPILFGPQTYNQYIITPSTTNPTIYNSSVPPVVYNEVASAAFRLHTLVRDLFSRCTPDGKRIDQLWLHDIIHKNKFAYDIQNNGIDSLLCGSLYDYGFAYDGNYAYQIRHRLFESTNSYGQMWRNDLISINICRAREHGIPTYNKYREFCNFPAAYNFEDFGDTINYEGIQLLKRIYKYTDDVDLFVGLNLEDPVPGGLIGPVSACLLGKQFQALQVGDRFYFSNAASLKIPYYIPMNYPFWCFICQTVDIDEVPQNPFLPPSEDNPLEFCSTCTPINSASVQQWNPNPVPAGGDIENDLTA